MQEEQEGQRKKGKVLTGMGKGEGKAAWIETPTAIHNWYKETAMSKIVQSRVDRQTEQKVAICLEISRARDDAILQNVQRGNFLLPYTWRGKQPR